MKKVLAWAVALALVLSSFTMAFAADAPNSSQFSDADQIQYTEAVDVMVATGVINGYPDGTFGPAKTVKRSEMAKMIAVMLNGGEDIGDTFKGACTFADSKDHWAAGYIAYCASQHIIDGRSADVFDPEAEVTGTEVAKMALCALGYDSQIQGYVGADWAANVLKDAKKIDLFDGLKSDFVPANPCSREEAAQILFNTLKSTMVEYDTSTSVVVGDATVTVSSKVNDQTWPADSKKDDNGNGTKELYEDAFGGDLSKTPTTDNGKPAHKWTYNKDKVGTYPDDADESVVADEAKSVEDAVKDATDNDEATVATMTIEVEDDTTGEITEQKAKQVFLNGVLDETATVLEGDTVELFETDVDNAYRVVIMRYVADRISEVNTDVKSSDAEDGVYAYVTLENLDKAVNDDAIAGFNKDTYVKDAVVAIAYKGADNSKDIVDSYIIEKETTGEWSKDYAKKMTVDGTSYDKLRGNEVVKFDGAKSGDDVDLYLINNYAAAVVKTADNTETLFGVIAAYGSSEWSDGSGKVKILTPEGDFVTYDVDSVNFTPSQSGGLIPIQYYEGLGSVVAYTVNEDGTVDLDALFFGDEYLPSDGDMSSFTFSKETMTAKGLFAGYSVKDDVAVYEFTGDSDVDTYSEWSKEVSNKDNWTMHTYDELKDAEEVTGFAVLNEDGDIAVVYITEGLTAKDTLIAIYGSAAKATSGSDAIYDVELYVNGDAVNYDAEAATALITGEGTDATEKFNNGDFVVATLNSDGVITAIRPASPADASKTPKSDFGDKDYVPFDKTTGLVSDKSGATMKVDGYKINIDGAAVYKIKDGKIDADGYGRSEIQNGMVVDVYQFDEENGFDVVIIRSAGV